MNIHWILKSFNDLTPAELYAIMRLRIEVFVVEQNCVFQDLDNRDPDCLHFMGWSEGILCAYTRIVPPGVACDLPAIGRVVTSPQARGNGLGRTLMEKSITEVRRLYGNTDIKVGAQLYLKKFYTSLGFIQTGDMYLEDGIEHIEMIKPA